MEKKKNVVVIYTDQQRSDTLGCNGSEFACTPNIDSLANDGIYFENYYVTNPVCAPSRASFLTGLYPSEQKIGDNGFKVSEDIKSVNKYFSEAGYKTANIGKLHFLPHCNRTHQIGEHPSYGFDVLLNSDEPGCYDDDYIRWVEQKDLSQVEKVRCGLPTEAKKYGHTAYSRQPRSPHQPYIFEGKRELTHSKFVSENANNFIEENKENPFFLIAGFYAPHAPLNPCKVDVEKFQNVKFPKRIYGEDEESFLIPSYKDLSEVTEEKWRQVVQYYHALMHHVDECIGEIIDKLKKEGLYEDTIIVFTTDHGEYLGDHNRVHKGMPGHDIIAKVPMIFTNAGVVNKRTSALMSAVDFVPTIVELAGLTPDRCLQGKSQQNVINGSVNEVRDAILIQYFNKEYQATTIVNDQLKYYVDNQNREILFDLKVNPNETINFINKEEYAQRLQKIQQRLILELMDITYSKREKEAPY